MISMLALLVTPALAGGLTLGSPDGASTDEGEIKQLGGVDLVSVGPEAIINGEDADEDDFPMTGGTIMEGTVYFGTSGMEMQIFMCSSTLIAPDVVLIAAHCLDDDALTYGMGSVEDKVYYWSRQSDLTDYDGSSWEDLPEDAVTASSWVMHEGFDLFGMSTGIAENDDIALLFLDEPVFDVPFAYLPQSGDEIDQLEEGVELTVVGWGQQTATSGWSAPPAGTVMLKQQGLSDLAELGSHEFQVGADEDDVRKCHGDSGGPSFMTVEAETDDLMRVVGVTSHAYDSTDCDSKGGVDTRVDAYLDWIEDEMLDACEDGTRSWCDEPGLPEAGTAEAEDENTDLGVFDDEGGGGGKGCGCSAGAAAPAFWGLLGGLGLFVRRRRG